MDRAGFGGEGFYGELVVEVGFDNLLDFVEEGLVDRGDFDFLQQRDGGGRRGPEAPASPNRGPLRRRPRLSRDRAAGGAGHFSCWRCRAFQLLEVPGISRAAFLGRRRGRFTARRDKVGMV